MSRRAGAFVIAGVCLSLLCACGTKPDDRAQQFSRLPNWTGQWEIVGASLDAAGGIHESLQDVQAQMSKWGVPPYKPEVKPVFDAIVEQARAVSEAYQRNDSDPSLSRPTCAFGFPMLMIHSPLMFEALITPEETALVFSGREMRHIYTDGRALPPEDERFPSPWGDSIGHWDDQTLVVDTVDVEMPPDMGSMPPFIYAWGGTNNGGFAMIAMFSRKARFQERIRMLDKDHLEDRMTIIDDSVFSKPWEVTRQYRRVTRLNRMVHEDCVGEERNPIVGGRYTLTPPPPPSEPLPPPFN